LTEPGKSTVKKQMEALITELVEGGILLDQARDEFEKKFIATALARTKGNRTRAARMLGVHRNTLGRNIALYKLNGAGS